MVFYLMSTLTLALMAVVTPELQQKFGFSDSETRPADLGVHVRLRSRGDTGRGGGRPLGRPRAGHQLRLLRARLGGVRPQFRPTPGSWWGGCCRGWEAGWCVPVSSPIIARDFLRPEARNRGWGVFASGKGLGALVRPARHAERRGPREASRAVYPGHRRSGAGGRGLRPGAKSRCRAKPGRSEREAYSSGPLGRALGAVAINRRVLLLGLFNAASLADGARGCSSGRRDFLRAHTYGDERWAVAAYLTAGSRDRPDGRRPGRGRRGAIRWGRMPVIAGLHECDDDRTALVPCGWALAAGGLRSWSVRGRAVQPGLFLTTLRHDPRGGGRTAARRARVRLRSTALGFVHLDAGALALRIWPLDSQDSATPPGTWYSLSFGAAGAIGSLFFRVPRWSSSAGPQPTGVRRAKGRRTPRPRAARYRRRKFPGRGRFTPDSARWILQRPCRSPRLGRRIAQGPVGVARHGQHEGPELDRVDLPVGEHALAGVDVDDLADEQGSRGADRWSA